MLLDQANFCAESSIVALPIIKVYQETVFAFVWHLSTTVCLPFGVPKYCKACIFSLECRDSIFKRSSAQLSFKSWHFINGRSRNEFFFDTFIDICKQQSTADKCKHRGSYSVSVSGHTKQHRIILAAKKFTQASFSARKC